MEQGQNNLKKKHTPDQKFKIVKEQLTTKTSVTEICKKYGIHPSLFYKWQERNFYQEPLKFLNLQNQAQQKLSFVKLMSLKKTIIECSQLFQKSYKKT